RFLESNPRYTDALDHGGNSERFIYGIHRAGYATDPQYADKVLRVKAQIDQMNLL
ncbi:glucosaminidase domain-containing protein, partial [Vibrio metoecus]